jgi:hypothetical protein
MLTIGRDVLPGNWPWGNVIIGVFIQFPHFWVCMMCPLNGHQKIITMNGLQETQAGYVSYM